MIESTVYLSNSDLDQVCELVGLSGDELETIVGRFRPHSVRAGQLRGELVKYVDGTYAVRHHFSKKLLWSQE